jgi:hypothetical protein
MARPHFVIDGSNLATEGRTMPSFEQLRDAVSALRAEQSDSTITVVVDASFEHRIDKQEQPAFHAAEAAGDIVSPPAGAIGRGDGFLLQIANRTGGTVVSNDSFQEFHGEYDWLFEPGRLIGGKPVPGVGWIFSLRSPVRGPKSHRAVRVASRETRTDKAVTAAIAAATADALAPPPASSRPRRRRAGPPPGAVNEPNSFLRFVINHPLGDTVDGVVEEFASHGAFVRADGVRAYVPLTAMGEPPPTRARDALQRGGTRPFVVQAFDAPRRGVELALPGFAHIAGTASAETVEAEIEDEQPTRRSSRRSKAVKAAAAAETGAPTGSAVTKASSATARAKKAAPPAKKKAAAKKATTRRPTKKSGQVSNEPVKQQPTAKKTAAKQTPAKQTGAKQTGAKKTGAKKTTAKQAPAKQTGAKKTGAKKTPAKQTPGKKTVAKQQGGRSSGNK